MADKDKDEGTVNVGAETNEGAKEATKAAPTGTQEQATVLDKVLDSDKPVAKKPKKVTKRPVRLDLTDMPRDTKRVLGSLRQNLCASFNYCRKYPLKMEVLKQTLQFVLSKIEQWEKEHVEFEKSKHNGLIKQKFTNTVSKAKELTTKEALDEFAEVEGIKLDARKSLEDMQESFETKLKAQLNKELKK